MKYIKSINEFFDSEELKSEMEIDYLQGKIPFKEIVKDKNFYKQKDLLLSKLLMNCPFVVGLNYHRLSNNLIQIGFQHTMNFGQGNDVLLYYVIEVMEHATTQRYICNIYCKCIGNGQTLFDEKLNKPIMPYSDLVKFINVQGLNMLIDFTKFTERTFNYKYFPFTNRNDVGKIHGSINNN